MDFGDFETIVGLEIHAQLQTQTKLFCSDRVVFGSAPNTRVSPVSLAHPGTLPILNRKAVELAIRMGIACNSEIEPANYFARKNYFYPDLPKGYQLSQHTTPICKGGYLDIETSSGSSRIRLQRIHLEEDAGKSVHESSDNYSNIDLNRAGTPLIEIVTEPDLRTPEQAFAFVTAIRKLVRYLDVCDGNMEEGSLRCDVNISVKKKSDTVLGTRVEVKNLNSIRNVKKSIEIETNRLFALISEGETIVQETRSFDAATEQTFSTREKEDADDYRYFTDPDLSCFHVGSSYVDRIRAELPELPATRVARYINEHQLSTYDASSICEDREFADYYESVIKTNSYYKAVANWMLGPVRNWLNENNLSIIAFPLSPSGLSALVRLVEKGKVSFSVAATKLWNILLQQPDAEPFDLANENNLLLQTNEVEMARLVDEVLLRMANKVDEYKKGKKGLLSLFVGEAMKLSKGKADPRLISELITKKLLSTDN